MLCHILNLNDGTVSSNLQKGDEDNGNQFIYAEVNHFSEPGNLNEILGSLVSGFLSQFETAYNSMERGFKWMLPSSR